MNRRDFLKGLATLTGAVIVAPAILPDTPVAPIPTVAIPIPSVIPDALPGRRTDSPTRGWTGVSLTIDGETYPVKAAELISTNMELYLDATLYWTPQIDNRLAPLAIFRRNTQLDVQISFDRERIAYQLPMRLDRYDVNASVNGVDAVLRLVGNQALTVRHQL